MKLKTKLPDKVGIDPVELEDLMVSAMTIIGDRIAREARARVKKRSGHLSENISVGLPTIDGDGQHSITVGTGDVPYAMALEFGSGLYKEGGGGAKYPIVPVKAESLAFPWENHPPGMEPGANGLFYFKKVMHPGIHPQPYLRPAFKYVKPFAKQMIINAIKHAAKRYGK